VREGHGRESRRPGVMLSKGVREPTGTVRQEMTSLAWCVFMQDRNGGDASTNAGNHGYEYNDCCC
jgi:hypothetical protein